MVAKRNLPLKKLLPLFAGSLILLFMIPGCLSSGFFGSDFIREASFIPGIYEGTGQGRQGPIRVRVQISPGGIEDLVILSHRESTFPGAAAMEELLEEIFETGSTDLDIISGATFSSRGFLEAVENALLKASGTQ